MRLVPSTSQVMSRTCFANQCAHPPQRAVHLRHPWEKWNLQKPHKCKWWYDCRYIICDPCINKYMLYMICIILYSCICMYKNIYLYISMITSLYHFPSNFFHPAPFDHKVVLSSPPHNFCDIIRPHGGKWGPRNAALKTDGSQNSNSWLKHAETMYR